jgi:hypothetical protein
MTLPPVPLLEHPAVVRCWRGWIARILMWLIKQGGHKDFRVVLAAGA